MLKALVATRAHVCLRDLVHGSIRRCGRQRARWMQDKSVGRFSMRTHSTHGLVAMTSAYHAEGRQFDPGWVYLSRRQPYGDNCDHSAHI